MREWVGDVEPGWDGRYGWYGWYGWQTLSVAKVMDEAERLMRVASGRVVRSSLTSAVTPTRYHSRCRTSRTNHSNLQIKSCKKRESGVGGVERGWNGRYGWYGLYGWNG